MECYHSKMWQQPLGETLLLSLVPYVVGISINLYVMYILILCMVFQLKSGVLFTSDKKVRYVWQRRVVDETIFGFSNKWFFKFSCTIHACGWSVRRVAERQDDQWLICHSPATRVMTSNPRWFFNRCKIQDLIYNRSS